MNEKIPSLVWKCFRAIFIIMLVCKNKRVYCACTRFLCMQKILVHAQHSCACTGGARDQGRDQQNNAAGPARGGCFFVGSGLGPWPLQCMHKSAVHAQECCACTRILCMHKNLILSYYIIIILSYYIIILYYSSIILLYILIWL